MFLFIRLVLGHFIADFPLQFNKVYELKHKGLKGGIPHALLVTGSLLIVSWPYLYLPRMWGFIFFVAVVHLFQDSIKISYGKLRYTFWLYILDQIIHIATIAVIFLTDLKYLEPPHTDASFILNLYNNDSFFIYLSALIVGTYNGHYLMRTFRATFFANPGKHDEFEKWYGMLERAGIVTMFLLRGFYFFLIPLILILRVIIFSLGKERLKLDSQFISPSEMALSWIIAGLTGAGLYLILSLL